MPETRGEGVVYRKTEKRTRIDAGGAGKAKGGWWDQMPAVTSGVDMNVSSATGWCRRRFLIESAATAAARAVAARGNVTGRRRSGGRTHLNGRGRDEAGALPGRARRADDIFLHFPHLVEDIVRFAAFITPVVVDRHCWSPVWYARACWPPQGAGSPARLTCMMRKPRKRVNRDRLASCGLVDLAWPFGYIDPQEPTPRAGR
jgi:hypothetical protein